MGGPTDDVAEDDRGFLEKVAETDLRLGHDVDRATLQSTKGNVAVGAGQSGADHDRDGIFAHDLAQEGQTVHPRHLDVEQDDVGPARGHFLHGDQWIGGRDHVHALRAEHGADHLPHHCGVVDD